MHTKDFTTTENSSQQAKEADGLEPVAPSAPPSKEEPVAADIKNAHATGDGSFGRNDESLPDDSEEKDKKDNNY